MELSTRPLFKTSIALTMAGAIALSPVIATNQHPLGVPVHLPRVTTSQVQLAAVISPPDVAALTANLQAALESAGSTVSAVVDGASQTLASALSTAAGLSNSLWDQLIAAAGGSPALKAVLVALKSASGGALRHLSDTVSGAGDAITLTTGQVAELLTSTVTGTVGTAVQAVANVVNNPLSASSYIGLLNTPFGIAGLALQNGITGISQLGSNGLQLGNTLVHGVTDQVFNVLSAVNDLLDAGKTVTDIALINGTLTAIQGIVSAPVNAVLAGVNGLASAVTDAGVTTLGNLAGGANAIVGTWLGSGSTPGAIIKAASAIGTEPLSLASYTHAVSILVGAGASTIGSLVNTAGAFASMPFRVGADLTGTGASVVNSLVFGVAKAASGLLQAVGLSPLIAGLPNNLATVVTGAINAAALATKATLNTIATAIDIGHAITGLATSSKSATTVTLNIAKVSAAHSTIAEDTAVETDAPPATGQGADTTKTATTETVQTSTPPLEGAASIKGEELTDETKGGDLTVDSPSQAEPTKRPEADPVATSATSGTPTTAKESGSTAREDTDPATGSDAPKVKKNPGATAGDGTAVSPAESADNYGRHAAPTDRKAGAASSATGPTTATGASASDTGGRHRRANDTAHKAASDNDTGATAGGSSTGGRHAATGKHAAAA